MAAYLRPERSWFDRAADAVERSWSRVFFLGFCGGSRSAAARMGAPFGAGDALRIAITAPFVLGRFLLMSVAATRPALRGVADRYATRVIRKRLTTYGVAEFTTDPHSYPAG
ncbi:hypothetical protein EBN03_22665 [Nocardia stercoris]|uniref:Uncharacterized protein n=2 Tax=Nocardia stercoris TaxID=2483361 RepID=A0A3M2KWW6_9NOCA|nr:hypothetical protein EBN03_22665 [Nocardia stercoris]